MKIIRNRFVPFRGYSAINLFGLLFVPQECSSEEWGIEGGAESFRLL